MLGGVGVHHVEPLLEVVDEHDGRLLTAERGADPFGVLGQRHLLVELGGHVVGQRLAGRDQDGGGQRVVLGLADQVCGDVRRVGGVVGQHGDLGRSRLGVDTDDALDQALGAHRVDVARPGDQVDGTAAACAVREHRDRLGAADGVHLVDAEQRARSQDRRVRPAAEAGLRRGRERDRGDAGDLRGHDVHDHRGNQRRQAAGHVETHPLDRHHALRHPAARDHLGDHVGLELGLAGAAQPGDRLLQGGPHRRVQTAQCLRDRLRRYGDVVLLHAVEPGRELQDGLEATGPHGVDDRADDLERAGDVGVGAGHHGPVVDVGRRSDGNGAASSGGAQVDTADHAAILRTP